MRRIVTRLVIAQLIPVGIKLVRQAARKRKSAKLQTKASPNKLDASSNVEIIEGDKFSETDQADE